MTVDETGSGFRAAAGNAGVTIGRVTNEREIVRNKFRRHTKLFTHSIGVANLIAASINLHYPVSNNALPEILIRRPDANFLHAFVEIGRAHVNSSHSQISYAVFCLKKKKKKKTNIKRQIKTNNT